jgi:hypothetical protein
VEVIVIKNLVEDTNQPAQAEVVLLKPWPEIFDAEVADEPDDTTLSDVR